MAKAEKTGDLLATTGNNTLPQVVDMTNFTVKVPILHNGVDTGLLTEKFVFNPSEKGLPNIVKVASKDGTYYKNDEALLLNGKKFLLFGVQSFFGVGSIPQDSVVKNLTGPNGETLYERTGCYPAQQIIAYGIWVDNYTFDAENKRFKIEYELGCDIVGIHLKGSAAKGFIQQLTEFRKSAGAIISSYAQCLITFGNILDKKNCLTFKYKNDRTIYVARHTFELHHDKETTEIVEGFISLLSERGFAFEPDMELGRNLAKFAKNIDDVKFGAYSSKTNKAYADAFLPDLHKYNIGRIATIKSIFPTTQSGESIMDKNGNPMEYVYAEMRDGFESIEDSTAFENAEDLL